MEQPSRLSRTRTDLTSGTKVPELDESLYDFADSVSLGDLLAIEPTRHWAISLITNVVTHACDDLDSESLSNEDRAKVYVLHRVNNMIHQKARHRAFSKCKESHVKYKALQEADDE